MGAQWDDVSWGAGSWSGAAWNNNAGEWGYNESEDAMVELQSNEVLVDHQAYT